MFPKIRIYVEAVKRIMLVSSAYWFVFF